MIDKCTYFSPKIQVRQKCCYFKSDIDKKSLNKFLFLERKEYLCAVCGNRYANTPKNRIKRSKETVKNHTISIIF